MREIPGFKSLKAFRWGRWWYIVDCMPGCGNPFRNVIGGYHGTYRGACIFAHLNYQNDYP